MIFQPEMAREIRAGRKTQTRRPVRRDQDKHVLPCRYKPGKSYAVQPGRGKPATHRVLIQHVRQERLGDITYADARAEGFHTTNEFKVAWVAIHSKAWLDNENALLDEADNDDDVTIDRDQWITHRSLIAFEEWHASKTVWVITFTPDHDTPRFLALQSDELYVTSAAQGCPDEPEAVSEEVQSRISERAGMVTAQWRTIEQAHRDRDRVLLSREDQLARLQRAARLRSVDIRRETWALETMLNTATPEAFTRKVRKTEQRVFRSAA